MTSLVMNNDLTKLLKFMVMQYKVEVSGQIECNDRNEADIVGLYLHGNSHQVFEPSGSVTFHTHPKALVDSKHEINAPPSDWDILSTFSHIYNGHAIGANLVCAPEGIYSYSLSQDILDVFISRLEPGLSVHELKQELQEWLYDVADICGLHSGSVDTSSMRSLLKTNDPVQRKYAQNMLKRAKTFDSSKYLEGMKDLGVNVTFHPWSNHCMYFDNIDGRGNDILRWAEDIDIEADRLADISND